MLIETRKMIFQTEILSLSSVILIIITAVLHD